MPISLAEREGLSCGDKGQNNSPFDPVTVKRTTVYSVGSCVTQKHFGQSSLMLLLHVNIHTLIRFIQIFRFIKCLSLSLSLVF